MKTFLLSLALLFAPLTKSYAQKLPDDQLLIIFGSSGYVLYKVLDFANDHGFLYIKILSYDFHAVDHKITGSTLGNTAPGGRYFELRDENAHITFLCFEDAPEDPYIIDLKKYRSLIDDMEEP
jgi:hypothetical protein